ncbi:MAG: molybdopterin biosynthesis protein MoeB, partial [Chloroflexi bacterium]
MGIADHDAVEESNLQRQILHSASRVGRSKVSSAMEALSALNPDIALVGHSERVTSSTAADILSPYDVIVDGSDNFETRYAINEACVRLGKP